MGTITKLLLKTTPAQQQIVSGQGVITHWNKFTKYGKFSQKVLNRISGLNSFEYNGASRLQGPSGSQCATSFLQLDQAPVQIMYNQLPSGNQSNRLYIQDVFFEYSVANATNALTNLDIYDLNFKREMDVTDGASTIPDGAWNTGELNQGNSLGLTMLGSYPTRIDNFKQFYQVAKKESHILSPGDVHRHKIHIQVRRFLTGNRINSSVRYAGLTTASMLVASGNPVDNVGTTTGKFDASDSLVNTVVDASFNVLSNVQVGNISSSPVALNITWRARYNYRWISDTDNDLVISNGMPIVASPEVMQNTGVALAFDET